MTGLLDTNVALYLLGGRMAAPLPTGSHGVSVPVASFPVSAIRFQVCPRRESNSHLRFRKPSFYPLNYGDD